jgi:hypothetical protein
MSKDYEEFMSSQQKKEKVTVIKTSEINEDSDDKRLDLILKKLENIEKHLGIYTKTIYDDMKPAYSVKDAATILGCTPQKVRQYIKYNMLDSFRVGYKKMIRSESIKKLIQNNL